MAAREYGSGVALQVLGRVVAWLLVGVFAALGVLATYNSLATDSGALGALNLLLAAQSGWGKSFKAQHVIEKNLPEYDHVVVLDYKDEYRGLVKAGLARWWIGGPREASWSSSTWHDFIQAQRKLVVARHDQMQKGTWQSLCASVIAGARRLGDVLIVVDEAHFVAPQTGKVPSPIEGLATTGRGEGASSMWVTQRPATMEETVIAQCQARLLGGFESDADLSKIAGIVEYNEDLHNPGERAVASVPEELYPTDRETPVSLQKHENDEGHTIGSEWVYSDNTGERERRNTEGVAAEMESTHYGRQGKGIKV